MSAPAAAPRADRAADLPPEAATALRDLVLALADSKRVLGLRYSDRMLGAPTLEAGIAASSMAQDEWGHARLTYALLSDFGEEPSALEHERSAAEYRSAGTLDRAFDSWSDTIAAALLLDTALTVQYGALVESRYAPVHNRVQKLLDEERIHFRYAAGWARSIAAADALRDELRDALARHLPEALRWLGREEAESTRVLLDAGVVREGPDALRARLLARVGPVLAEAGFAGELGLEMEGGAWRWTGDLDADGWDDATRRAGGSLDEETAARARGDRNRARPGPDAAGEGLPASAPCPFCEGTETELVSPFGGQLSVAQYWCRRCRTGFEYIKWEDGADDAP